MQRCADVLDYEQPDWSGLRIVEGRRHERRRAVTVQVEAVAGPGEERISEFAVCVFAPGERATVERVVIGDRTLGAGELALVNAELLLRDLGGDPVRAPAASGV